MNIYHNTRVTEYRAPFGAVEISSDIRLAVKVKAENHEQIKAVMLRLWQDDIGETLVEMTESDGMYQAEIQAPGEGGLLWYYFIVNLTVDGEEKTLFYGNNEMNTGGEGKVYDVQPPSFQVTVYRHEPVPEWFKEGIVYQIFPDRFARDDEWKERCEKVIEDCEGLNGPNKIIEEDWYKPAYYIKDEKGRVVTWPLYGGSIKGIEEKLNYLKTMGVSVIYLNPISKSASNHRYDTADYMEIDPMLGTEEDFQHFAKAAEAEGISIILDGVYSHTGADSKYFDKYGNYGGIGAFENENSEYRDWFDFRDDDPAGYRCWWGVDDLPEVNESNESFRQLICGEDGVLAKWLRLGARGWRLDVADELPDAFIQEIRQRIKAESVDNLLMGEVWEDASNKVSYDEKRKYFMGDELDSTMNYPVRDMILEFVKDGRSISEIEEKILSLKENYPPENFFGAMNLIGSHDRERVLSVMGVDENYDNAAKRVKMASILQYALPGVPCIYYGDETGMIGGADPENRSGFIWDRENPDLQFHYRQLGLIYDEHPVLKSGDIRMVSDYVKFINGASNDVFAFVREGVDGEKVIVLANRSDEMKTVSLKNIPGIKAGYALELLSSTEMKLKDGKISDLINLEPITCKIICLRDEAPSGFDIRRSAGAICHVSSIPGGKLGKPAKEFVNYLVSAGINLWQILPLNPPGLGDSPYSSNAAFAGNPAFINRDELPDMEGYEEFCEKNSYWLDDYAAYVVLKNRFNGSEWYSWPEGYRDRKLLNLPEDEIEKIKIEQYYFASQWDELREYANVNDVEIMGDLPVFVSADSADAWANRDVFQMDETGRQKCHAGVPPDYFSPEGQDWGNPLYDWREMKATGYDWWIKRLGQCMERYDYVRLDHFRSFAEYFAIPDGKTPAYGKWQHGPGIDFFRKVRAALGPDLKILAEDLGQLDIGVYNLLKLAGLPGMNVWQFSQHEMENMTDEVAATRAFYTGTHDNQTLLGWVSQQGGSAADALAIIRKVYESGSPWAIIQIQDMFMLDDSNRMNVPGTVTGNWSWRIPGESSSDAFSKKGQGAFVNGEKIAKAFKMLAEETGRSKDYDAEIFMKSHGINHSRLNLSGMTDEMVAHYQGAIAEDKIDWVKITESEAKGSVIAVDMGGTNIRVARIRIGDGEEKTVTIERQIKRRTPGRDKRVTCDAMFDEIASMIEFVDKKGDCDSIAFSFSFPLSSDGDGDACIVDWDKELLIVGGPGRYIGKMLNGSLERIGQTKRRILVLNDSVSAYLAHRIVETDGRPCLAGFVLGTGVNICFQDKDNGRIYNLESGGYEGFARGDIDEEFDLESDNPGMQKAEKMISGEYIHKLVNKVSAKAIEEGFVSSSMNLPKDKIILAGIEDICITRAAAYSAVMIASAMKMATKGEIGNYVVIAEGSVFWKTPGLKKRIEAYVNEILKDDGIIIEFVGLPADASLIGAAAAL